jgi:hypothetical protein
MQSESIVSDIDDILAHDRQRRTKASRRLLVGMVVAMATPTVATLFFWGVPSNPAVWFLLAFASFICASVTRSLIGGPSDLLVSDSTMAGLATLQILNIARLKELQTSLSEHGYLFLQEVEDFADAELSARCLAKQIQSPGAKALLSVSAR